MNECNSVYNVTKQNMFKFKTDQISFWSIGQKLQLAEFIVQKVLCIADF